mgnify:CR=1 FL=1
MNRQEDCVTMTGRDDMKATQGVFLAGGGGGQGPSSSMPYPGGLGAISQALEGNMSQTFPDLLPVQP